MNFEIRRQKTLEAMQIMLDERGFVVVGIKPFGNKYSSGDLLHEFAGQALDEPLEVIAKAKASDWIAQSALIAERLNVKMKDDSAEIKFAQAFYKAKPVAKGE